jgi:bacterioferritin-associated ferredoxin
MLVVLEGRMEDAEIHFYIRRDPGDLIRVGYELIRDRSPVAPLSLLASLIQGKPLAYAQALTLEQFADHYGLDREIHPNLLIAVEALQAALAALLGEPAPFANDGPLICHCLHVRQGRIQRLIRERRLETLAQVRFWTRACSGCRSCRTDLEEILACERSAGD